MDIEYCLNISFTESGKNYYFKTTDNTIKIGDYVVVNTVVGLELGKVTTDSRLLSEVKAPFEIIPIVRKATKQDLLIYKRNKLDAIQAKEIFNKFANQEHLSMDLVDAQYTLDKTKILFTYIAADRVDFRNLLKLLAGSLHCRIELRQVNVRERAQIIGGIGVCGLPLCCTTFLKEFEGVSLSKAKNQMLTINIPKGYFIDVENSNLSKGIIKFRNDNITLEDIYKDDNTDYAANLIILSENKFFNKLSCIARLIDIANYYNKGWKPDWSTNKEYKYCIQYNKEYNEYSVYYSFLEIESIIYFKNEEDVQSIIDNPNFRDILDTIYKD